MQTTATERITRSMIATVFFTLFQIACMGVGGGASVLSAQFYGKGDYNNVKKTVAIMLRVILSVAVVCMVISLFFPEELLRIYTCLLYTSPRMPSISHVIQ